MPTREHIINEIRRIAKRNGRAPGRESFEKETGVRRSEWHGVHFRSWGDAVREAGYEPNAMQRRYSPEHVLRKYAEAVRYFGRIPAEIDLRGYSRDRKDFPGHSTFTNHFGTKDGLIAALAKWVRESGEFPDLVDLLPEPAEIDSSPPSAEVDSSTSPAEGYVYLLKSGNHYKIGRSDQLERRVREIRVALPEELTLEHTIRTDDPSGIEAYWHRRFAPQRAKGEWFQLTGADVRAFKRRKYQ